MLLLYLVPCYENYKRIFPDTTLNDPACVYISPLTQLTGSQGMAERRKLLHPTLTFPDKTGPPEACFGVGGAAMADTLLTFPFPFLFAN